MSIGPTADELERFRSCVARRLGLQVEESRLGVLAEMLGRRAARDRLGVGAYLALLEQGDEASAELKAVAQELTITETYFFRNADQLRAFGGAVLPALARSRASERQLRILSAGCASGEEPYTLAMLLREAQLFAGWRVSILALDINVGALDRAAKALYSQWALRETSDAVKERWFRRNGDHFALDESVRQMVSFEERNLALDDTAFFRPEAFDVVFCRNVTMYFTRGTARAVIARIARSLTADGFLFLGHAETLRGLSQAFHLRHTHDTFYYQRRDGPESSPYVERQDFAAVSHSVPLPPALDAASWVETIRVSSERVQSLLGAPGPASRVHTGHDVRESAARSGHAAPGWNLALVVELLRQERFVEAKNLLNALPPESARDPDVLLLRAVLLTHGGDLALAENVCGELLDLDQTNAGARYLMALCREHGGDSRGAAEQDQIAAYLDPSFAMPRLHLGLLARRLGDASGARRELMQALSLLEREDSSRLLLFGGGFGRDALIAVCRAELARCGGEP